MKGTRCQTKEEELAVLRVRLERLTADELRLLLQFVMQWRQIK